MSDNHPAKKRRGRPRKTQQVVQGSESLSLEEPIEVLNSDDFKALQLLRSLPLLSKKFEKLLKNPAVHKRFKGNARLLMGLHELSIYKVAESAGCSQSTLSRMLNLHLKQFEKGRPLTFVGIAQAFGVSVYVLLSVDLREKVLMLISEEEKGG